MLQTKTDTHRCCINFIRTSIYFTDQQRRCKNLILFYVNQLTLQINTDVARTWYDARTACLNNGGDLASINSPTEQRFVESN